MKPDNKFWGALWRAIEEQEDWTKDGLFGFFALAVEELNDDVLDDFFPDLKEQVNG